MAGRYSSIPAIPTGGIANWQGAVLGALKENVELLTNQRNEADRVSVALTRGDVTVLPADSLGLQGVTARGNGFTISGREVAALEDQVKLIEDVQQLIADVAYLRNVLNTLINQLRG